MLTNAIICKAKPKDRPYKLFDGNGLHLLIRPSKNKPNVLHKYWRLKIHLKNTEILLSLGIYPFISLEDARAKSEIARKIKRSGEDPRNYLDIIKKTKFIDINYNTLQNNLKSLLKYLIDLNAPKEYLKTTNNILLIINDLLAKGEKCVLTI